MPKFTFTVPVDALQEVTVEAENAENAKVLIALGDGDFGPLYHDPDAEANIDTQTYYEVTDTVVLNPNVTKFKQVFADCVIPNMTEKQWQEASEKRELQWKSNRMSLSEAAAITTCLQSLIKAQALTKLLEAFPDLSPCMEVMLAREYSMAIYLHFPELFLLREDVKEFVDLHFQADEVDFQPNGSLRIWWD